MAKLSVIGTGYLGLTHAACMASLGHNVIAFDIDESKIASLKTGKVPFHEPGLDHILKQELESGRLTFTTSWEDVASRADVHFLCVGTPQSADSTAADMSQVRGAIQSLAPLLTRPSLVVGKSTVPVGTAQWVADTLIADSPAGADSHLVWNPEFLREGFAVEDTLHPDRIVLGVSHESDVDTLKDVYAAPLAEGTPLIVSDYPTAELVKVAANAFLATKISFINAFADLCDVTGGNVTTLADAIGFDTRIGRRFLNAGIGFGGGCLPKDIRALQARAAELGLAHQFDFLRAADDINLSRRSKVVELAQTALGGSLNGAKIAVLGAAFKPDSDDIRDSPALSIAAALHDHGAHVTVHDPEALHGVRTRYPHLNTADTVNDVLVAADIVLHLTEWKEYRALNPAALKPLVKNPIIIDGRNVLDLDTWVSAGWSITYLGKPGS
jgi:UDPglucose 6-dehydrogenase